VTPTREGASRKRLPKKAAAATPQARPHLTPADRLPSQLSLFDDPDYSADGMYPPRPWAAAEWHLRLAVNRLAYEREPSHWWIRDLERRRSGAA
jgi:hypothetical protein